MITDKEYLEAQKLIIDYQTEQLNKPVVNHSRFLETIKERESMCTEVLEFVNNLSYDLNPVGGRPDMFDLMKKEAIEQIIEINSKLGEILKSLCFVPNNEDYAN
jgi:hypothetical protein